MKTEKTFYIISSLSSNNSWKLLPEREKFSSEEEALQVAEKIVRERANAGNPLSFYVLKATALVGPMSPPIEIKKLK